MSFLMGCHGFKTPDWVSVLKQIMMKHYKIVVGTYWDQNLQNIATTTNALSASLPWGRQNDFVELGFQCGFSLFNPCNVCSHFESSPREAVAPTSNHRCLPISPTAGASQGPCWAVMTRQPQLVIWGYREVACGWYRQTPSVCPNKRLPTVVCGQERT